jgi:hypothetical protein
VTDGDVLYRWFLFLKFDWVSNPVKLCQEKMPSGSILPDRFLFIFVNRLKIFANEFFFEKNGNEIWITT